MLNATKHTYDRTKLLRFHLNGHTTGFCPQTLSWDHLSETLSFSRGVGKGQIWAALCGDNSPLRSLTSSERREEKPLLDLDRRKKRQRLPEKHQREERLILTSTLVFQAVESLEKAYCQRLKGDAGLHSIGENNSQTQFACFLRR